MEMSIQTFFEISEEFTKRNLRENISEDWDLHRNTSLDQSSQDKHEIPLWSEREPGKWREK